MNGKLYMHNLVKVAQQDGTPDLSIAMTENTVLARWASWILGEQITGPDYRLWQSIYETFHGSPINGVPQQRIVADIVFELSGIGPSYGLDQPELISNLADFYG